MSLKLSENALKLSENYRQITDNFEKLSIILSKLWWNYSKLQKLSDNPAGENDIMVDVSYSFDKSVSNENELTIL